MEQNVEQKLQPELSNAEYNVECLRKIAENTYENEQEKMEILQRLSTVFEVQRLYAVIIDKQFKIFDALNQAHPELNDEINALFSEELKIDLTETVPAND